MAIESKAILVALAELTIRTTPKEMYKIIAKMADVDGVYLKSYEDAMAEIEEIRAESKE